MHLPTQRHKRCRFDPWVGKMPWNRKWQLTLVFLSGKFLDRGVWWATVYEVTKSHIGFSMPHLLYWWPGFKLGDLIPELSMGIEWTDQLSSVTQRCLTLCDPKDCSTPGFQTVHHRFSWPTQTPVHHVGDAIQPSHLLSPPSPHTFNLSQNQGLFQWVCSLHQVAKVLEFQL